MHKVILFSIMFFLVFHLFPGTSIAYEHTLELESEAGVLMDTKSGAILYGKNEDKKMYPASLTKIATAIYAIEMGDLEEEVVVSEDATKIDGTRVYLNAGEQVSLKKLIQGMMINSGNDAALAIAIHMDGTLENYAESINEFLEKKTGVKNTHFVNPHGLFNEEHYTTAEDLGLILNYAMKNKEFREIYGMKKMDWKGKSWNTTLFTHHKMLKGEVPYEGVTGGKTGFVDQSKQTLATTAKNDDIQLTAILLKSESKRRIYQDTIKLFDFGFMNFKSAFIPRGETFTTGEKKYATKEAIFVTEPIGITERRVSPDGMLMINDGNGEVIHELQLKEVLEKKKVVEKSSGKPEQNAIVPMNSVLGGGIFLLALALWTLNRRQRRKRRYRIR